MKHVALFRNLNLGHAGSPTGAALVDAFGGPEAASSFQTNGTVVFDADDPGVVAETASTRLAAAGFGQRFVVRPMPDVAGIVEQTPELDPDEDVYRLLVSFYDVDRLPRLDLPLRSTDGLVEIRGLHDRHAWSVCWKPRNTAGDATALLESLLGVPVTTRTAGTLARLVRKHGPSGGPAD